MPFYEGHKLSVGKGRPEGRKNERTLQWEMFVEHCMSQGLEKFKAELNKLEGKDYVDAFLKLLEFHQPKLARTIIQGDGDNPVQSTMTFILRDGKTGEEIKLIQPENTIINIDNGDSGK
jgi:hypothetical protein